MFGWVARFDWHGIPRPNRCCIPPWENAGVAISYVVLRLKAQTDRSRILSFTKHKVRGRDARSDTAVLEQVHGECVGCIDRANSIQGHEAANCTVTKRRGSGQPGRLGFVLVLRLSV